jgi:hypothetical protein
LDNPVRPVRAPAAFAKAVLQAAEKLSGHAQYTIPLTLALEYVAANRDALERIYDAEAALGEVMRALKN